MSSTPNWKKVTKPLHRFHMEKKGGKRTIISSNPICRGCLKEFRNGEIGYLGNVNKILSCRACLGEGSVDEGQSRISGINDRINTVYLYGEIKIEEIEQDD